LKLPAILKFPTVAYRLNIVVFGRINHGGHANLAEVVGALHPPALVWDARQRRQQCQCQQRKHGDHHEQFGQGGRRVPIASDPPASGSIVLNGLIAHKHFLPIIARRHKGDFFQKSFRKLSFVDPPGYQ